MEAILGLLFVPMVLFLVVVAPLWMILSFLKDRRAATVLTSDEQAVLDRMTALMDKMEARLATLEKILDTEHPDLRNRD